MRGSRRGTAAEGGRRVPPPDRQAKLDDLLTHRWVKLTRFAEVCDGISPRTLQRWAIDGRLPASRRFGRSWWVDVRAFLAMRRDGSEDLLSA